jgi:hypothetical protein
MLKIIKKILFKNDEKLKYFKCICPFCLFENNVLMNKYGGNTAGGTCKCGASFNIN